MTERQIAFNSLKKVFINGAYSSFAFDYDAVALNNSTAFSAALFYGTIERKITLDFILSKYLKNGIGNIKKEALIVLEMGAYQILYMDKVPTYSAVNESVRLMKNNKLFKFAGLCNAVLRKLSEDDLNADKYIFKNYAKKLSFLYSVPESLAKSFTEDYGLENAERILQNSFGKKPMYAVVNDTKCTASELKEKLLEDGFEVKETKYSERLFKLMTSGDIAKTRAFKEGLFHIQDIPSYFAAERLNAVSGDVVFDLCAAPGGKSFSIAEGMGNTGIVKAFDIHEKRLRLIKSGAIRLSLDVIKTECMDASVYNESLRGTADRVLCDVLCSGYGVLAGKPEIRFKEPHMFDKVVGVQYNILNNAYLYLKENGKIVYSTCTLRKCENEDICNRFLEEHGDMKKDGEYETIFPNEEHNGFFHAAFVRK